MKRSFPVAKRRYAAFTILEVMVATFVLTMAIGSSLITLGRGFGTLDSARCITYASQIMQSELEKMRLTNWGDGTTAGTGSSGVSQYPTTETAVTISTSFFSSGDVGSRMTMTRTATDVHDGMIQITLKVSWNSYDGRPMSRTYVTYYGRNGLYDFFVI